jgi:hypothetical protein
MPQALQAACLGAATNNAHSKMFLTDWQLLLLLLLCFCDLRAPEPAAAAPVKQGPSLPSAQPPASSSNGSTFMQQFVKNGEHHIC